MMLMAPALIYVPSSTTGEREEREEGEEERGRGGGEREGGNPIWPGVSLRSSSNSSSPGAISASSPFADRERHCTSTALLLHFSSSSPSGANIACRLLEGGTRLEFLFRLKGSKEDGPITDLYVQVQVHTVEVEYQKAWEMCEVEVTERRRLNAHLPIPYFYADFMAG